MIKVIFNSAIVGYSYHIFILDAVFHIYIYIHTHMYNDTSSFSYFTYEVNCFFFKF